MERTPEFPEKALFMVSSALVCSALVERQMLVPLLHFDLLESLEQFT